MKRHGFTLIEILIAVLVLGLLGTAISEMMTKYTHRISVTNKRVEALRHAEEQMREILRDAQNGNIPETGSTDGEVGEDLEIPSGYLWQMEVEEYEIELPKESEDLAVLSPLYLDPNLPRTQRFPVMRRVTITVHKEDTDVESGETFTGYVVEAGDGFGDSNLGGGAGGARGRGNDLEGRSGSRESSRDAENRHGTAAGRQGREHREPSRRRGRRSPLVGNTSAN